MDEIIERGIEGSEGNISEGKIIYISDTLFRQRSNLLNEGLTNIGYTLEEAIMEAVDDSLDADAHDIQIQFLEQDFQEFTEEMINNHSNGIVARRYSYIVCDNGIGSENVENIFNFGNRENATYSSKEEYWTKNGRFHYGCISHINVGDEVNFYSKAGKDNEWIGCTLKYDRYSNCGYISGPRTMNNAEKGMISAAGITMPTDSGSILFIRGVRKTELDSKNMNEFELELVNQLGITYCSYLYEKNEITKENRYTIKVKSKNVIPINPLCEDLEDELIKPKKFGEYTITLDEIFNELNDRIYQNQLIDRFCGIFSKEEMGDLSINIKLVAINKNFSDPPTKAKIKKKFSELNDMYYPSAETDGFYNKRNRRYIGRALGMLSIVKEHNSHTKFRGEISFSPVFDEFFKVQVNKNRNYISKVLVSLIQKKILADEKLYGGTVATKIQNAIENITNPNDNVGGADNPEGTDNIGQAGANSVRKVINKRKTLKKSADRLKIDLEKYYQSTDNIDEIIKKIESSDLDELKSIEESIAQLNSEYQQNYDKTFKDIDYLIDRVIDRGKRKTLIIDEIDNDEYGFLENMKVPSTEGELYGIFCLVYSVFSEEFDFETIGYHTRDGVDLIVDISRELFEEFNFTNRFGVLLDKVKDDINDDDIEEESNGNELENESFGDKHYTFIELKLDLPKDMNHSLDLVSHIICWERPKFIQMDSIGGLYSFSDIRKKDLLVGATGNKVKVVYLKDIIERKTSGKFMG